MMNLRWPAAIAVALVARYAADSLRHRREQGQGYELRGESIEVGSDDFLRATEALTMAPVTHGNDIELLINGDEIFPALLETMAGAKRTVNFLSYLYWSGEIGETIAEALCERAQAGIEVNVLLDAVGSAKMDRDLVRKMDDAGVTFAYFRPPKPYAIRRVNNRTHRKLLIVDGEVGMTGGVGIADQWTGNAQDPDHWRDTHTRVRGPIVRGLQGAFAENWLEATGDVLVGPDYLPELEPVGDDGAMQVVRSTAEVGDTNVEALYFLAIACATQDAAPHVGVLRAAAGVRRGADRRRAARRRRPGARPRAAHRQGLRPPGRPLGLRGAARGRRADLRVLPDDDPRQDADDRRRLVLGRLGELRQSLLPAAGRGHAVRLLA